MNKGFGKIGFIVVLLVVVVVAYLLVSGGGDANATIARMVVDDGRRDDAPKYASIEVYGEDGNLFRTIKVEEGGYMNLSAKLSPDKKSVLYTWGVGDTSQGAVYNIGADMSYEIENYICFGNIDWSSEGLLSYTTGGCVTGVSVMTYRSVNAETPWVFEEVTQ